MSEHRVELKFDERFIARPWGVFCSCGFAGCAANEAEAKRIKTSHELERAKSMGYHTEVYVRR